MGITHMTFQFDPANIDSLLSQCKGNEDIFGENGLVKFFIKSVMERALDSEMTEHLGYVKHDPKGNNTGNSRNGSSKKTVAGAFGELEIDIPRDRQDNFKPIILKKGQTRIDGFDEKIISLYARGMTTRDIQDQLKELYGVDISPTLISSITESVMEDVKAWQNRTLDRVYPIVYLDALVVKIKDEKQVINKAIHLALGVNMDGQKELLGMWITHNEGAKFWLSVLTELKNRGLHDIFIACVDGLTGFPDAIESVYPATKIQLCIVHMVRNSLKFVPWKDKKDVVSDLKTIYCASTQEQAEAALTDFGIKWDKKYPAISCSWLDKWENVSVFFDYPTEIRKVIYTTNAIESLNMTVRKVIKNKRFFPSDDAACKQIFLAIRNISKRWTMPIRNWSEALGRFAIDFGDRVPK
jgi:putative transposase